MKRSIRGALGVTSRCHRYSVLASSSNSHLDYHQSCRFSNTSDLFLSHLPTHPHIPSFFFFFFCCFPPSLTFSPSVPSPYLIVLHTEYRQCVCSSFCTRVRMLVYTTRPVYCVASLRRDSIGTAFLWTCPVRFRVGRIGSVAFHRVCRE